MKNLNHYRLLQWIIFSPILIPICILTGAWEGIQHTFGKVVQQIKTDVTTDVA